MICPSAYSSLEPEPAFSISKMSLYPRVILGLLNGHPQHIRHLSILIH